MLPPCRRKSTCNYALITHRAYLFGSLALACAMSAQAAELETVVVHGNYENAVGTSDAASQGSVTSKLIENRPIQRPGEVMEFVPGVIVTQHSGEGKANQYFLRGFNLDHGTDFATFIDGMPVNMPSHAHGQGYSDMNWLIPELVSRINYKKGPYYADVGDFSSAGSADVRLFDKLPNGNATLTAGPNGYVRALLMSSSQLQTGQLLYAAEVNKNDGPWDNPDDFHKFSGVLRYSLGDIDNPTSVTAMLYSAQWNATDQIPRRAVEQGLIGRFGSLDTSDGGQTSRFSLSFNTEHHTEDTVFKLNAYAIRSHLDLFSNFTYYLDNPSDLGPGINTSGINGDQFEQAEHRQVFGLNTSQSWMGQLGGKDYTNTLGLQIRQDNVSPVGLYSTEQRQRKFTTQESEVHERSVGLYAENNMQWAPWFRSIVGIRTDHYNFDVTSSIPQNTGKTDASISSPKVSLIFGPWSKTEYFANYGYGFHSNDARGTTEQITPKERQPTTPVDPLVRSKGGEIGMRTEIIPNLQSSLSLWRLTIGSELVFSGDAGDTEPSRASKRRGVEWNNHYTPLPWLLVDLDLAVSRAEYTEYDPAGQYIPGSIDKVASFGVSLVDFGPWFGQYQFRYFGPRPLIEDNSQRSEATMLSSLRGGYRINKDWRVTLDIFNLFNSKASDIDYYYTSRLQGEPQAGVDDIHFHPVEPRTFRLTVSANF